MIFDQDTIIKAYVSVIAQVAAADGHISTGETAQIKGGLSKLFSRRNLKVDSQQIGQLIVHPEDFSQSCAVLKQLSLVERISFINQALFVALDDDIVTIEESQSINNIIHNLFEPKKQASVKRYVELSLELVRIKEEIGLYGKKQSARDKHT